MCGIAGIFTSSGAQEDQTRHLDHMLSFIAHRGPDHQGMWTSGKGVFLGHRRLSILDLQERAHQPMLSADHRYSITYNGEIYNYLRIKEELESKGHDFVTTGDTEVLLHAFMEWGESFLEKLDGMFALAIWDNHEKKLFLARDRFGEKPLYYFQNDRTFVFSSELKAVRAHPDCPKTISSQAMREYMELGYVLTSSSIIEGVKKLPPAHFMRVSPNGVDQVRRYWDCTEVARKPKLKFSRLEEAAEALVPIMKASVRDRLVSDVPVGVFLSGGIDSNLISIALKKWLKTEGVDSFSAGFAQKSYSEVDQARESADKLGLIHHDIFFDETRIVDDLSKIIQLSDEPFADTSLVPTYYLSQFASRKVKVVLSGDAGDELFAGYETYIADQLYQHVGWIGKSVFSTMDKVMGLIPASDKKVGTYYKIRAFLRGAAHGSAEEAHWSWRRLFSHGQIKQLLSHDLSDTTSSSFDRISPILKRGEDLDFLDRMQCLDLETWLVDDILVKLDRMSMAHSLEGRIPFLSNDMVSFALGLPEKYRISGGRKKAVLRQQVARNLSSDVAYRKKAGFNSPVSHWFKGVLNGSFLMLLEETAPLGLINVEGARQMLYAHEQRKDDHGYRLFALYCLAQWLNQNKELTLGGMSHDN